MRRTLALPARVRAAITAHARRQAPDECCGLLVGTLAGVVDAVAAANVADRPAARYLVDPAAHIAAMRTARARGLAVIGAYHSHVNTPPVPSPTDTREALSAFLYLIVSLQVESVPAAETSSLDAPMAAWELVDGNFVEVTVVGTT